MIGGRPVVFQNLQQMEVDLGVYRWFIFLVCGESKKNVEYKQGIF